ncbi:MAG TPA: replication-associated recombination protein A [Planctomycetota bacterium]|nr:replication-associated recombination protein A [Planctomycetota bacterium]
MSDQLFPTDELETPFGPGPGRDAPLAERMRPARAADFVGQTHLVGEGRILAGALAGDVRQSLVLWGPPGCGKTTLARLIAEQSDLRFVPFSAVLAGIKEVRGVMAEAAARRARDGKRTLLFVDEIHRFNKAQQDAFLPFVESGDILLIGATTENPSFELNSALLSRARVVILQPLASGDLVAILRQALEDAERGLGGRVRADDATLAGLAAAADGDARRALNLLETAAALLPEGGELTAEVLAGAVQRKVQAYDKSGDQHYDLTSALHKSVRNSDADASVYWITRMLHAGEERNYLARRLIRMAVEDVGLADPFALRVALDGADAFHRLGSPEGDLALVQVAVYLARAKKSNAVYKAYGRALEDVEQRPAEQVPLHLRNAPTQLMKDAGHGAGYRYAHDDPAAAREMTCLPPGLAERRYLSGS